MLMGRVTGEMPQDHLKMLGLWDSGSGEECEASKLYVPRPNFNTQGVFHQLLLIKTKK